MSELTVENRIEEIRQTTLTDASIILKREPTCDTTHHPSCDCQVQRYIREKFELLSELDKARGEIDRRSL